MHIYPEPFLSRLAWVILIAYFPFFSGVTGDRHLPGWEASNSKDQSRDMCGVLCMGVFITLLIYKILICKKCLNRFLMTIKSFVI